MTLWVEPLDILILIHIRLCAGMFQFTLMLPLIKNHVKNVCQDWILFVYPKNIRYVIIEWFCNNTSSKSYVLHSLCLQKLCGTFQLIFKLTPDEIIWKLSQKIVNQRLHKALYFSLSLKNIINNATWYFIITIICIHMYLSLGLWGGDWNSMWYSWLHWMYYSRCSKTIQKSRKWIWLFPNKKVYTLQCESKP